MKTFAPIGIGFRAKAQRRKGNMPLRLCAFARIFFFHELTRIFMKALQEAVVPQALTCRQEAE